MRGLAARLKSVCSDGLTAIVKRNTVNAVIKSFRCKDTEALFAGRSPRRFRAIRQVAERKLQMLDSAGEARDLRSPPGNRLELLSGDRKGQWSIRINAQWRLCFRFQAGEAHDVEIVDYH